VPPPLADRQPQRRYQQRHMQALWRGARIPQLHERCRPRCRPICKPFRTRLPSSRASSTRCPWNHSSSFYACCSNSSKFCSHNSNSSSSNSLSFNHLALRFLLRLPAFSLLFLPEASQSQFRPKTSRTPCLAPQMLCWARATFPFLNRRRKNSLLYLTANLPTNCDLRRLRKPCRTRRRTVLRSPRPPCTFPRHFPPLRGLAPTNRTTSVRLRHICFLLTNNSGNFNSFNSGRRCGPQLVPHRRSEIRLT
jgi:hypothetical protein